MKRTDIPKKHPIPFANAGNKNPIPQSGGATGAATLAEGFPPETMVPVIAGGIPPDGKDMNGVLFELSDMGRWANAGAEYTFDPGFSAAIGGYPSGAKLLSSDGKGVFISEIDDNTANPEVVSTKWVGFSNYRGAITATTGVHTLTALEASRDLIVVSGTLTGNVQLVFPAWVKHWQIINSTTGNFSITCKTATGSGVAVKGGFLTDIYGDGTSISSHANTDVAGVVRSVNTHEPDASGDVAIPMYGLGLGPVAKTDAYSNIAQFYRVNASSANAPPITGNIAAGVVSLPCDAAPSTGYVAVSGNGAAYIGSSNTPANGVKWSRIYTTDYKPTAQDTGALPLTGGTCSGQIIAPNFASTPNAMPVGAGEYADQLSTQAPFFQPNWQWEVTAGGAFVPIAKGISTRKGKGWPTAVSYGYLMPGTDMHAHPVIHALGDSGQECIWEFDTQDGGIHSKAGTFATIDRDIPPGIIHAWPGEAPPAGWLMCNGSGFSPSFCPLLARVFPSGQVPDLRGVFLRAKDNGKGYDPNRVLGDLQGSQNASHTHGYTTFRSGVNQWHISLDDTKFGYSDEQTAASGGSESRPINISVNYIVRAA